MGTKNARAPVFSGSFYPSDPGELRTVVKKAITAGLSLSSVQTAACSNLQAVIVPHAGYVYSGEVAGAGYAVIQRAVQSGRKIKTVYILAPAHRAYFQGIALSERRVWETPIGGVSVSPVSKTLCTSNKNCCIDEEVHQQEHSIEVQLPFLLEAVGKNEVEIVPMLVSDVPYQDVAHVLSSVMDDESLLIVSTDLSHYLPSDKARVIDSATIDAIVHLDVQKMSTIGDACGKVPILVSMECALSRQWSVTCLQSRNSGDSSGETTSVVGYAAFYMSGVGH